MPNILCRLTIHGCPRTKKNSRTATSNGITLPSKAYRKYAATAWQQIHEGARNLPISGRCNVKALYYMDTHGIVDISGLHQGLHDLLKDRGIIADDNSRIVAGTDGSRVLYDKERPRVEVVIEEMDDSRAAAEGGQR